MNGEPTPSDAAIADGIRRLSQEVAIQAPELAEHLTLVADRISPVPPPPTWEVEFWRGPAAGMQFKLTEAQISRGWVEVEVPSPRPRPAVFQAEGDELPISITSRRETYFRHGRYMGPGPRYAFVWGTSDRR